MSSINIARTIATKRKERGITQDELAKYMCVSRVSISKWETGQSYPDIQLLPKLASYFDISMDELMGYEPQMTAEDIRKLNLELMEGFATRSFEEAKADCDDIIKKYYSCWPLLFQIGMIFMNALPSTDDEGQKVSLIEEAKELFTRVNKFGDNLELQQMALHSEAICELMLGYSNRVLGLLESKISYTFLPSINALRSLAYRELDQHQEAKAIMQDSMLDSIISLISDSTTYLSFCTDDQEQYQEICRRTDSMIRLFNVSVLSPISVIPFYLTAAEGFMGNSDEENALNMLDIYTEIVVETVSKLVLNDDSFFNLVDEYRENQLIERPFGMPEPPRDEGSIKQEMLEAIINNPVYLPLQENQHFKKIIESLNKILN